MSTKTLYDYIKEKATLEGNSSRDWQEASPGCSQQHYRAGASNCCLEILDWMERNPDFTQAKLKTAEYALVNLAKNADDYLYCTHPKARTTQNEINHIACVLMASIENARLHIDSIQPGEKKGEG